MSFALGFAFAAVYTLSDLDKWTAETLGEWSGRWTVRAALAAALYVGFGGAK